MLYKIVVSHGGLAQELVAATEKIRGPLDSFRAVCIPWDSDTDAAYSRIQEEVERLDLGPRDRVLLLATLFGDTPFRAASRLVSEQRIRLIGGINLPLLLKLACDTGCDETLDDLCHSLRERARCALEICDGGEASAVANGSAETTC